MLSRIVAQKVKDGWHVEIIETETLKTEGEVRELIRQKGLRWAMRYDKDGNLDGADVVRIVAA